MSEALQRWQSIGPRLRDPGTPFAERQRLLTELNAEFVFRLSDPGWSAHLEQARAELHLHLGEPLPNVRDPMGDGPFTVQIDGDTASLAGAGGTARTCVRRPR